MNSYRKLHDALFHRSEISFGLLVVLALLALQPNARAMGATDGLNSNSGGDRKIRSLSDGELVELIDTTLSMAQPPQVAAVSAASYTPNSVLAPDSIGALFGSNMASEVAVAGIHPLPLQLVGVSVNVEDTNNVTRPAPLFFVSPQQINFIVPNGTAIGPATITVIRDGAISGQGALSIDSVATGLFGYNSNGRGVAVAEVLRLRSDGTLSYEPIARFNAATNSFEGIPIALAANEQAALVIYGTGFRNNLGLNLTSCTIGGESAQVFYADAQPSLAGLDQANVRLSPTLAGRGIVNIVLTVGGKISNTVTITIQ